MAIQGDNDIWFRQDDFSAVVSPDGDGSVVVSLRGEFDLSTAADLRECLVHSEVVKATNVQIDMTGVTFLDSSNIGLLIAACKRTRSSGGAFSVTCGDGVPRRVLEISGLVEYLQVRPTAGQ